jgi:hypothetical protein
MRSKASRRSHGHRLSVIGYRLSVIGSRPSDVGYRSSVIGLRLSVVGRRPSVVGRRPSVVGYRTLAYSTKVQLSLPGTRTKSPYWLARSSVIGHRTSDFGYRSSVIGHSPTRLKCSYPCQAPALSLRIGSHGHRPSDTRLLD